VSLNGTMSSDKTTVTKWCSHRDNDFPCPDNVPDELRLPAAECPDCRIDAFHTHLDECEQCRNHPFNLCPTGAELLKAAATWKENSA
jgi:hypothetical protein